MRNIVKSEYIYIEIAEQRLQLPCFVNISRGKNELGHEGFAIMELKIRIL
jgi:hypothetical protein